MDAIDILYQPAHWGGGGPGPWILLVPLVWALVIGGLILLAARAARYGRGPWKARAAHDEPSAVTLLERRFAAGEIEEDEYRRRLSVLNRARGDAA
ncbi:SHOCT domain-containing protein [Streptomyces macrosporus]|uniref:SHOCT domain-containing protein n=1 Tax=Streptomyces macrosporus TaxID=44032 RepID=A0ABN3J7H0_9ACTN